MVEILADTQMTAIARTATGIDADTTETTVAIPVGTTPGILVETAGTAMRRKRT
jgi:hypothetical protein